MATAKLELRNLKKSFPRGKEDIPVVHDMSLSIPNLEFLAIIGPSGCGKSTLLRLIDGLIPGDSGEIFLDGVDIAGVVGGRGRGMVFQGFDLFPWRTSRGNIEFGLEVQGTPAAERKEIALHYINLVGLAGFLVCLTALPLFGKILSNVSIASLQLNYNWAQSVV